MKKIAILSVILGIFFYFQGLSISAQESSGEPPVIKVAEKNVAMMPCKYLNKTIMTEGQFMDLSTTLLDDVFHDAKTQFDSREYVNFRTVGNLMYNYFMKNSKADILSTLKTGDKIIITGKVVSCADQHAWINVDSVAKVAQQ